MHARYLSPRVRAIRAIGALGHDDLVGPQGDAARPPLRSGRRLGGTAIDHDAESGVAAKGDRQEVEELGVPTGNHDQVVRHPIPVISADGEGGIRVAGNPAG
jgi:hypothetical protein